MTVASPFASVVAVALLRTPRVVVKLITWPTTGVLADNQRIVSGCAVASGTSVFAAGAVNTKESLLTDTAWVAVRPKPAAVSVSLPGWVMLSVKVPRPVASVVIEAGVRVLPRSEVMASDWLAMPWSEEFARVTV